MEPKFKVRAGASAPPLPSKGTEASFGKAKSASSRLAFFIFHTRSATNDPLRSGVARTFGGAAFAVTGLGTHLHPSNTTRQDRSHAPLDYERSQMRRLILPLKLLVVATAAGALAVSAASAAPAKGKPSGPKPCHGKAKVMVVLKGTLANDPVATDTSFQLNVQHTNRWGRAYKAASQPLTINVDANTGYVKGDQPSTLDALAQNDQVVVKTKMSKCGLLTSAASPADLTAKAVVDQTP
jgi:hypothetical protein